MGGVPLKPEKRERDRRNAGGTSIKVSSISQKVLLALTKRMARQRKKSAVVTSLEEMNEKNDQL